METVLVVSYHYPPEEGSCSEKNVRIVKKLVDAGYKVIVITKAYKGYISYKKEGNVTVIRTKKNGVFHKVVEGGYAANATGNSNSGIKSKVKRFVSNSLSPDAVIDWVVHVKHLMNEHKELLKTAGVILSISSPYSAHIASKFLSEKLHIPYVLCYGDPWIYEPKRKRGKIRYACEKRLEKSLIDASKKLLLITDWNKNKYEKIYNISSDKVLTYHIGYDENECLSGIFPEDDGTLKVIYGGSLDKVHRNPQPFIEAMARVEGVKAYIYNSDNEDVPKLIDQYKVKDKVVLLPIVSSTEFYRKLYEMDALLLFGNKTPFQVPGKVFTYVSTKKGILYIKNNDSKDDGTKKVLNAYGNAVTIKNTSSEIVECLEKLKRNKESGVNIKAEQFEFHNTMQPIVDAINSVLNP